MPKNALNKKIKQLLQVKAGKNIFSKTTIRIFKAIKNCRCYSIKKIFKNKEKQQECGIGIIK